jgi:signal transduction histidine kinase
MSANAHFLRSLPQDQQLLGELLHSLSQPLTSLRCSLELSMDELADSPQQSVSAALQQTERVIGMIQLMREFLDIQEQTGGKQVALMPVVNSVCDDLSSIAAIRNIHLRVVGT